MKYELRPYSEFNYDLPIDFHDQELSSECAADLEQDAFGGILEGIWDHQSPPTNYGRFENEDMTAFMHRSEKENEESRLEKKALVARLSQVSILYGTIALPLHDVRLSSADQTLRNDQ